MEKSDRSSNVANGTRKWRSYHHSETRTAISSIGRKNGARFTRVEAILITSAITIREMVAVIFPLTVKVQKVSGSLRTGI